MVRPKFPGPWFARAVLAKGVGGWVGLDVHAFNRREKKVEVHTRACVMCTHTRACTCTHVRACMHTHAHVHTCVCVCARACTYTCASACTHAHARNARARVPF
jgi:hypothetical protein